MNAPQPSRHALAGPSKSHRWIPCPGSLALEVRGAYPDTAGIDAALGTFQHHVAAFCLTEFKNAVDYLGYKETVNGHDFEFNQDHADLVQVYVDTVRNYALGGYLFVEVELDISWITGEEGAVGTADAVIIKPLSAVEAEIIVIDLKTGRNLVSAEKNSQLSIYQIAAEHAYRTGKLGEPICIRSDDPAGDDDGSDLC